jgi:hypothetical protein
VVAAVVAAAAAAVRRTLWQGMALQVAYRLLQLLVALWPLVLPVRVTLAL